jgi:hypothetical protein
VCAVDDRLNLLDMPARHAQRMVPTLMDIVMLSLQVESVLSWRYGSIGTNVMHIGRQDSKRDSIQTPASVRRQPKCDAAKAWCHYLCVTLLAWRHKFHVTRHVLAGGCNPLHASR